MKSDIRKTSDYMISCAYFETIHAPGEKRVTDGAELAVSPNGNILGFTGTIFNDLNSPPDTKICFVDSHTKALTKLENIAGNAKQPKWSPDGQHLGCLADHAQVGDYQLHILSADGQEKYVTQPIEGTAEFFSWSPGGQNVLIGIAGYGADLAGCQGGNTTVETKDNLPAWIPLIDTGNADNLWRSIHIYDVKNFHAKQVNPKGMNCWEACWLGDNKIATIASDSHSEGSWYTSKLIEIDLSTNASKVLYTPEDQIGVPSASPDGNHIAIIEAVCSDRLIVCGSVILIDIKTGSVTRLYTNETEVTHLIWRNNKTIVFAGHRSFETVVGEIDIETGEITEHWAGTDRTIGSWYPSFTLGPSGGVFGIGESYETAPEIVHMTGGNYKVIASLATQESRSPNFTTARIEPFEWTARDGLSMHGWLVVPKGDGPFPLIMDIHGGPVWACRNRWQGRLRAAAPLAEQGFAIFFPNPRGSSTRGQDFARLVKGDMGGEDTHDYLSGLDELVDRGIADPDRLGVTGISYGGFASCWLITQDTRFAAALPISPVSNFYSQHYTSQIPYFDRLFLDANPNEPNGKHFHRSPVMFAGNVKTPTLQLTGALDQNTPPTQALEFHNALLEAGVQSELVTYPKAGHGIRNFPDVIDHTARYINWFKAHMG